MRFAKILAIILFIFSVNARASLGLGASIQNNATTFFLPIKFDGFFIEPKIAFQKYDYDKTMSSASSQSVYVASGFFLNKEIEKQASIYYGARLGYQDQNTNNITGTQKTYIFSPTFGIEYFSAKQVSLGLEYQLQYSYLNTNQYNNTTIKSVVDVILRYYFT